MLRRTAHEFRGQLLDTPLQRFSAKRSERSLSLEVNDFVASARRPLTVTSDDEWARSSDRHNRQSDRHRGNPDAHSKSRRRRHHWHASLHLPRGRCPLHSKSQPEVDRRSRARNVIHESQRVVEQPRHHQQTHQHGEAGEDEREARSRTSPPRYSFGRDQRPVSTSPRACVGGRSDEHERHEGCQRQVQASLE